MALFRWVLLLIGVLLIAGIFAYSRGWLSWRRVLPAAGRKKHAESLEGDADSPPQIAAEAGTPAKPVAPRARPARPSTDSMVVTVRIMPPAGSLFPAEELILALRAVGLQHGQYGIFHCIDENNENRARYSVASLVEPGSFDLNKLKESRYHGISIFMILPAPEDGVNLFDDMLKTARTIAKKIDGHLVDERGGALSVQRERYMREEVIEFLRCHRQTAGHAD